MKEQAMPLRPYKPGHVFRQHVPTSPSRPPVNETVLRKWHTAGASSYDEVDRSRLRPHIELPNGNILVLDSDTEAGTITRGGKIIWTVPSLRRIVGIDKWEITTSRPIVIFPGAYPKLKLHIWECEGHYFGPAILDQLGLVNAVEKGGTYRYKKGQEGELKVMTKAEWLWNLIPTE
jgi:hypothetical protein